MSSFNRVSFAACAVLLCGQLAGCVTAPEPVPSVGMSLGEMEKLSTEAEQALAANQLSEAGNLYVRIVTAYPDRAPAWFRLGTIYLRTKQQGAAQMAFEQSLRADPDMSKAYANLALTHLHQFRDAAMRALASPHVAEANKKALRTLLEDVNHTLEPAPRFTPAAAR